VPVISLGATRRFLIKPAEGGRIYDALLDDFEEGMTANALDPLFEDLKKHTVPLVAAIADMSVPVISRSDSVSVPVAIVAGDAKPARRMSTSPGSSRGR